MRKKTKDTKDGNRIYEIVFSDYIYKSNIYQNVIVNLEMYLFLLSSNWASFFEEVSDVGPVSAEFQVVAHF